MSSADTARAAVGITGNVISLALFLSPLPTFVQIWKKGSVEQYAAAPYLAALLNCMVWTLYGLPMVHPNSILVLTINASGTAIEFLYVVLFFVFSDRNRRFRVAFILFLQLIFVAVLVAVIFTVVHTHHKRSTIVGTTCILFNIMMYASPLAVMKLVITTKNVEYMPFFLSLAAFANGLAWTTYALIRFDPFITIPNGVGLLFGAAQLVLYGTYYKSTKRQMAERNSKSEADGVLGLEDPPDSIHKKTGHAPPMRLDESASQGGRR